MYLVRIISWQKQIYCLVKTFYHSRKNSKELLPLPSCMATTGLFTNFEQLRAEKVHLRQLHLLYCWKDEVVCVWGFFLPILSGWLSIRKRVQPHFQVLKSEFAAQAVSTLACSSPCLRENDHRQVCIIKCCQ